jgi:hypothetical protein
MGVRGRYPPDRLDAHGKDGLSEHHLQERGMSCVFHCTLPGPLQLISD